MIEFVKGHYSFQGIPNEDGAWSIEDHRLSQLVEVFGQFPKDFLARGTKTQKFFDEDGKSTAVQAMIGGHRHTVILLNVIHLGER